MSTLNRPIIVTHHARLRIKEMGLTDDRVRAVLADPEIEYGDDGNLRRAAGGDLCVVYRPDDRTPALVVVTVLPRTQEQYVRTR